MLTRSSVEEEISGLYLTTLGRSPDSDGVAYWVNEVMTGKLTVAGVAKSFFDQTEVKEKYDNLSTEDFVKSVYENVLGREAEQDGLQYWTNELKSGSIDNEHFIEAINNGATGDDALRLDNMKTVGYYYMKKVGINSDLSSQVLSGVDSNADSKNKMISLINFYDSNVNKISESTGKSKEEIWKNISNDDYLSSLNISSDLIKFKDYDNNFWEDGTANFLDESILWNDDSEFTKYQNKTYKDVSIDKIISEEWSNLKDSSMYEDYSTPNTYDDTNHEERDDIKDTTINDNIPKDSSFNLGYSVFLETKKTTTYDNNANSYTETPTYTYNLSTDTIHEEIGHIDNDGNFILEEAYDLNFDTNGNLVKSVDYDYYIKDIDPLSSITNVIYNDKNQMVEINLEMFEDKESLGTINIKQIWDEDSVVVNNIVGIKSDGETIIQKGSARGEPLDSTKTHPLVWYVDQDGDGTTDDITYFTYDKYGNTIKEEFDENADGTIDTTYESEWTQFI